MYLLEVLTQRNLYLLDRTFYYVSETKVEVGVRVNITFNNAKIVGYVTNVIYKDKTKEELEEQLGLNLLFIDDVIDESPILSNNLLTLAKELKKRYAYPLIGVLQTMLPPSLKPKDTYKNAAKIKYISFYYVDDEKLATTKLDRNEQKVIDKFKGKKTLLKKELNETKGLKSLLEKKIIVLKFQEAFRYTLNALFSDYEKEVCLNDEQNNIFKEFNNSNDVTYLLYGVTGSGKTEVYIKIIEEYKAMNKGAIILVPEIALTPLMISRLYAIFDDEIAVIHSSLTNAQIYDEYRKIAQGKANIVVGTRSAIFAPVNNLGIIIIDEENDECYKQDDQGLLYNAKDVAQIRAKIEGSKILLGSATPSIESMAKAKKGIYHLLTLKNRYMNVPLPDVSLVDRKEYKNFSALSNVYSLELIRRLKETFNNNQQAILFINRRGYSNYLTCRECGHVFKCPHCGLPLHYHKEKNILYCHHCEYKIPKPKKCPVCDSPFLTFGQFGIEKAEEDFKKLFPGIKYLVLDSDRTSQTYQIEEVLKAFNMQKAQVLIGTQIVAKGHDFPNVHLVGVLNADTLLNFPNYRSNEMTFSLLTQVIGRCGRKGNKGCAIVQSSEVNNYSILSAIKQDYENFYENEIKNRKVLDNPPFSSILSLQIETKSAADLDIYVKKVKNYLISLNIPEIKVYGPSLLHYNKFRCWRQIFVKYKKLGILLTYIEDLLDVYKEQQKVTIRLNFNPYSF